MTIHLSQAELNLIVGGIVAGVVGVVFMLVLNWRLTRKWHKPRGGKK